MELIIISQLFGIGAMISLFLTCQQTNRTKILLGKMCADVCWVFHYMYLGAYGGVIPNFVGIFREIVFINRNKKIWAASVLWPIAFVLISLTLGLFTFKSPINIMPICASLLVTVSLWCQNPKLTKIILIPVCLTFLIYDIFVISYVGIVNESISIISIIISFIRERKGGKRNA